MGHPLRRLRADRLQGHAARVHALEQADSGADLAPLPTRLGEALTALAAAALTLRARFAPRIAPWTLIGRITHGELVARPR